MGSIRDRLLVPWFISILLYLVFHLSIYDVLRMKCGVLNLEFSFISPKLLCITLCFVAGVILANPTLLRTQFSITNSHKIKLGRHFGVPVTHEHTRSVHLQFSVGPAKDKAKEPEQAHRRPDDRDPGDRVIGPSICQLITLVCSGFRPDQPLHGEMIGIVESYEMVGRPPAYKIHRQYFPTFAPRLIIRDLTP
jgi:hypothetical protein